MQLLAFVFLFRRRGSSKEEKMKKYCQNKNKLKTVGSGGSQRFVNEGILWKVTQIGPEFHM